MAKDIHAAVREICLAFPEGEEFISHGSPNFRVRGKTFATYVVNFHGDKRIALWLPAPSGAQSQLLLTEPQNYFVPPYVGVRGWIGVHLNRELSWDQIATLIRDAYECVAAASLRRAIESTPSIVPPTETVDPFEIDPLGTPQVQAIYHPLRDFLLSLPDVSEAESFGSPVWRVGKRTFVQLTFYNRRLRAGFWVGLEMQDVLTDDPRFEIPAYMGHNGWIALDLEQFIDWPEIHAFSQQSYRHFANKKQAVTLDAMLAACRTFIAGAPEARQAARALLSF